MLSSLRLRALIEDGLYRPAADSPLWQLAASGAHGGPRGPPFDANVRVNTGGGGPQNEISMDSDSAGSLYAGWNDGSRTSYHCGYGRSGDGGATWDPTDYYLGPRQEAGDAVVRAHGPVMWRLCMSFTRAPSLEADIMISKSTDGGKTWGKWIKSSLEGGTNDKPWLDFDGDHIYIAVYDLGPISFWKSDDGGATWGKKKYLGSGQGNCIMAGENGTVVVGWGLSSRIVRSTDWGETFAAVKSAFVTGSGGSAPRSAPLLTCAAHANKKDMYFSWAQQFAGQESVFVMRSPDGGATWGNATRVAPSTNRQIMPGVDVTVDGVAHVAWTEFVSGKVRTFYSNSSDYGVTWTPQVEITDAAGDIDTAFMGDYNALDASRQNRVGYIWCDTREGGTEVYHAGFWHGQPGGGGNVARIEVAPASANITVDQTLKFSAKAFDASNNVVNATFSWSATAGTVGTDGTYYPWRSGTFKVHADAYGKSGTAVVNVAPGAPVALTILPSGTTIAADQTLRFSAAERDAKGNTWTPAGVQWTVSGGGAGGTIDSSGLYTPLKTGEFTVGAADSASGLSNTSLVKVVPGKEVAVMVSPSTAKITSDERYQFSADAEDAKGNHVPTKLTWTVEDGRINETGFFSPDRTGTWRVTATSESGLSGNASVRVDQGAPVSIRVEPPLREITADDTAGFTAVQVDAHGNRADAVVKWSAEDGEISVNGTFTPRRTGEWTVTAALGNLSAIAKVKVSPGRLAAVTVEPAGITFNKGESGPFKVKPVDAKGNLLAKFAVLWSLEGDAVGELEATTGVFTARAAGEAKVKASVTAGAEVKEGVASVLVRGGIADIKGGGQLPIVLAALGGVAAVSAVLLLVKRKRARSLRLEQSYSPAEAGSTAPEEKAKANSSGKAEPAPARKG
jgi:hypothetical protein